VAENFLLPLILGISILNFIVTATVVLSPNDEEIRAEADLMQRIARARQARSAAPSAALRLAALRPAAPWPAAPSPAALRAQDAAARRPDSAPGSAGHGRGPTRGKR
jgi:hypothetical protein